MAAQYASFIAKLREVDLEEEFKHLDEPQLDVLTYTVDEQGKINFLWDINE